MDHTLHYSHLILLVIMHPNGQILTKLGNIQEVIYNRKAHARIANAVILAKKKLTELALQQLCGYKGTHEKVAAA